MALVSLFRAAATKALMASCGVAKVCSSAADARTGSVSVRQVRPKPDASDNIRHHPASEFVIIGNVFLKIIGEKY